jgi:hypothetical protein
MTKKNEGYITDIPLTVKINTNEKPTEEQIEQIAELFNQYLQLVVQDVYSNWLDSHNNENN